MNVCMRTAVARTTATILMGATAVPVQMATRYIWVMTSMGLAKEPQRWISIAHVCVSIECCKYVVQSHMKLFI